MKKTILLINLCLLYSCIMQAQQKQMKMDSLSYSIGVLFGASLKQQGLNKVSSKDLGEALDAVMNDQMTKISKEDATQIYSKAMSELTSTQGAAAREEGEKFLAENKKRSGVVTTTTGLQYEVIKMGDGVKPSLTSKVQVHYHGTLPNGRVFDSSVQRGEPIWHPVNKFIAGWTEALMMMPVGSKWKLFIPYNLAYGDQGAGADIKPYSALIFELELLAIE